MKKQRIRTKQSVVYMEQTPLPTVGWQHINVHCLQRGLPLLYVQPLSGDRTHAQVHTAQPVVAPSSIGALKGGRDRIIGTGALGIWRNFLESTSKALLASSAVRPFPGRRAQVCCDIPDLVEQLGTVAGHAAVPSIAALPGATKHKTAAVSVSLLTHD
jgi:hypothetical protein